MNIDLNSMGKRLDALSELLPKLEPGSRAHIATLEAISVIEKSIKEADAHSDETTRGVFDELLLKFADMKRDAEHACQEIEKGKLRISERKICGD